jgi:hypothetical protein
LNPDESYGLKKNEGILLQSVEKREAAFNFLHIWSNILWLVAIDGLARYYKINLAATA